MGMRIEFLPVYFLLASVLTVGGVFCLDYVQDRLEPQSGLYRASGFGAARCSRQQAKAVLEGMLGNGAVVHPGGDKKKLAVSKRKGHAG